MFQFAKDDVNGPRSSTPVTARKRLSLGRSSPQFFTSTPRENNQDHSPHTVVGRPLVQSAVRTWKQTVSRHRSQPPAGPRQSSGSQNDYHNVRKSVPQLQPKIISLGCETSGIREVTQNKCVDNWRWSSPFSLCGQNSEKCSSEILSTGGCEKSSTPYLWSRQEESTRSVEPMDISPIKCHAPTLPLSNLEKSEEILTESRKKPTSQNKVISQKKPTSQNEVISASWCNCIFKMVFVSLTVAAAVVTCSFFASNYYSNWCIDHQKMNITRLSEALHSRVFGQHIAIDVIPRVIDSYLQKDTVQHHNPLVISLHGWTGVGKNYLSFLVTDHLTRGKPKKIIASLHYPHHHIDYSKVIADHILSQISTCAVNIFVIDEIDKSTESVLKGIVNILRLFRSKTLDLSNKKVIFLLLSNTGGSEINHYLFKQLEIGRKRESVKQKELVDLLKMASEKTPSFVWFKKLLDANLIDVTVPFLPLERVHVEDCVRADLQSKGFSVTDFVVQKVIDEIVFSPRNSPVFSTSGCRKVAVKVDLTVH